MGRLNNTTLAVTRVRSPTTSTHNWHHDWQAVTGTWPSPSWPRYSLATVRRHTETRSFLPVYKLACSSKKTAKIRHTCRGNPLRELLVLQSSSNWSRTDTHNCTDSWHRILQKLMSFTLRVVGVGGEGGPGETLHQHFIIMLPKWTWTNSWHVD